MFSRSNKEKPPISGGIFSEKLFSRFRKNKDGATAIEFAIVGGPFFLLIFAIIETSLYFFAAQYLENSVDDVTRKLRTGQLKNVTTEADFKTEFCKEIIALFNCGDIKVRVETAGTFDGLTAPPRPKDDGSGGTQLDDGDFTFDRPGAVEIVQVTAMYAWPVYTNYSASLAADNLNGDALIIASSVVRTEPFE